MSEAERYELKSFITGSTKRLNAKFSEFLTVKLNSQGFFCRLQSLNNWFPNNSDYFWRGLYKCAHKTCDVKFKTIIETSKSCRILVYAKGNCEHDSETKKIRCSGKAREDLKMKLLALVLLKSNQKMFCWMKWTKIKKVSVKPFHSFHFFYYQLKIRISQITDEP